MMRKMMGKMTGQIDLRWCSLTVTISATVVCKTPIFLNAKIRQNGKFMRAIAVTTAQRVKAIPEVPTIAEAGVPGYEATLWYGFLAPARTPDAILKKLNAELATVLKSPDVIEKLATQGVEAYHTTPEQFATLIRVEHDKWAKIIKAGGVKTD